ncbi:hypothetical protein [Kitasatospora sp. NPDC088783]|uniref:hypothetical protein n=1 Tax=Kitasatospora sp. NPDC088783 TaxID=3364077 RepID=UPI0037FD99AC
MTAENSWYLSSFVGMVQRFGFRGKVISAVLLGPSWAGQIAQYFGRCLQIRTYGWYYTTWWIGGCVSPLNRSMNRCHSALLRSGTCGVPGRSAVIR